MSNTERLVMIPLAPHTERDTHTERERERAGHNVRHTKRESDKETTGVRGREGGVTWRQK